MKCLIGFILLTAAVAQTAPPRKVYISVDMEGISGVANEALVSAAGSEYDRGRKLMAADTNAAIRGAFAAGAHEIVVNDSHGSHTNLRLEDLAPGVRLITDTFKRYGMMQGLDETFDAALFIGYHAKAGSTRGFFAHTGDANLKDLEIDGRSVGEGSMNELLAAWYGVPVVLITGDDVAVEQFKEFAPNVRGVVVKRAINTRSGSAPGHRTCCSGSHCRCAQDSAAEGGISSRQAAFPRYADSGVSRDSSHYGTAGPGYYCLQLGFHASRLRSDPPALSLD